jgi:hypothetical protein
MEVRDELTVIQVDRIEEVLPAAVIQSISPASSAERDEPFSTSTAP